MTKTEKAKNNAWGGLVSRAIRLVIPTERTKAAEADLAESRAYYSDAYDETASGSKGAASAYETRYIELATGAAEAAGIKSQIERFVAEYELGNRRVLEVGSGRGYLQDAVPDYTGLDISPKVERFYRKKFVCGSATAMPFPDNSFDAGWSVWAMEHIPEPDLVLREIRRVMTNNAVVFLLPAWNCTGWPAKGYSVRPYSDFNLRGKLIKASIPFRSSKVYRAAARIPGRMVREAASRLGPTNLHYRRLEPNYKVYWEPDADAINGLDRHEMMLWFRSRGDECLNCSGRAGSVLQQGEALIVRIRK